MNPTDSLQTTETGQKGGQREVNREAPLPSAAGINDLGGVAS
jgi:prophage DNA circulation protein